MPQFFTYMFQIVISNFWLNENSASNHLLFNVAKFVTFKTKYGCFLFFVKKMNI